ncbi:MULTISPECIES: hypothetical protein [unclassified Paraburkholderia]|uniref:hypothetical protein n=1 Tax=unclassified Paraburkholderia TaxID=2615204 RepID=UPI002AB25D05|nr:MULTISPECIES: hypothetical protein [unclassified Paraburkholderia]
MSTFPLVQVEGALAMPHMRPLNRVPPPFGREWSLMPSHFSLRTELHALYAAFLRTICLSAEAFRKVYSWEHVERAARVAPEPPRPAAAPIGAALNAAQAQQAAAEAIGAKPVNAAQSSRSMQAAPLERTPPPSHKLAASAVAIGGAALLAWIVASHTQPGNEKDRTVLRESVSPAPKTAAIGAASAQSSARLADERAAHDRNVSVSGVVEGPKAVVAAKAPDVSNAVNNERGIAIGSTIVAQREATPAVAPSPAQRAESTIAVVAPATTPAVTTPAVTARATPAPAPAFAPAIAPAAKVAPAAPASVEQPDFTVRARANQPVESALVSRAASEKRVSTSRRTREETAYSTRAAREPARRHAAQEFTPHLSAPVVTTHRTQGMYSEAAEYSPHQFATNASDEYASLATYANTHAALPAANRAPLNADSTEWVNHVAQRRVTEVPDHFDK